MSTDEGMPTIRLGENWKQEAYIAAVMSLKRQLKSGDPYAIERAYAVVSDMEDRLWQLSDKRRKDVWIAQATAPEVRK